MLFIKFTVVCKFGVAACIFRSLLNFSHYAKSNSKQWVSLEIASIS